MRLPEEYDMYGYNKHTDKLWECVREFHKLHPYKEPITHVQLEDIVLESLRKLREIDALVVHLQLALEETIHLRDRR